MGEPLYGDFVRPGDHVVIREYVGSLWQDYLNKIGEVFDVRLKGKRPLYYIRVEGVKGAVQLRRHQFALCMNKGCK